jgi:hypothetical protein
MIGIAMVGSNAQSVSLLVADNLLRCQSVLLTQIGGKLYAVLVTGGKILPVGLPIGRLAQFKGNMGVVGGIPRMPRTVIPRQMLAHHTVIYKGVHRLFNIRFIPTVVPCVCHNAGGGGGMHHDSLWYYGSSCLETIVLGNIGFCYIHTITPGYALVGLGGRLIAVWHGAPNGWRPIESIRPNKPTKRL